MPLNLQTDRSATGAVQPHYTEHRQSAKSIKPCMKACPKIFDKLSLIVYRSTMFQSKSALNKITSPHNIMCCFCNARDLQHAFIPAESIDGNWVRHVEHAPFIIFEYLIYDLVQYYSRTPLKLRLSSLDPVHHSSKALHCTPNVLSILTLQESNRPA